MYWFLSICLLALSQVQGSWARVALEGEITYQAGIVQTLRNGDYLYLCSGAVLNQRWVLTVALCIELNPISSIRVFVGSNNVNSSTNVYYNVDAVRTFNENPNVTVISRNNIALVRITTRFLFNARVQPITISNQAFIDENTLTVSAFRNPFDPNYTDRLQILLGIGVQDNDDCPTLFERDLNKVRELVCLTESSRDVGNENLPPFSFGGGPIVDANRQLRGLLIVSINSVEDETIVGVALRVALYRQFIYATIN